MNRFSQFRSNGKNTTCWLRISAFPSTILYTYRGYNQMLDGRAGVCFLGYHDATSTRLPLWQLAWDNWIWFTRHVVSPFDPLHQPSIAICAVSCLISKAFILISTSSSRLHYTTAMISKIAESKALHEKIVQQVRIFLKIIIIADYYHSPGISCYSVSWRSFRITRRSNGAWTTVPHVQRSHRSAIREGPGRCSFCWGAAQVSGGIYVYSLKYDQVSRVYSRVYWPLHCGCSESAW